MGLFWSHCEQMVTAALFLLRTNAKKAQIRLYQQGPNSNWLHTLFVHHITHITSISLHVETEWGEKGGQVRTLVFFFLKPVFHIVLQLLPQVKSSTWRKQTHPDTYAHMTTDWVVVESFGIVTQHLKVKNLELSSKHHCGGSVDHPNNIMVINCY